MYLDHAKTNAKFSALSRILSRHGAPITVHNGGSGYREYLYVKNIPPHCRKNNAQGNRIYNITDNRGFTVNDLIHTVEKILGKKFKIIPGKRLGMDMKYQMDAKRVKKELRFEITYSFEDGIKEYFDED